jgi:hypothetical protein
MHVPHRRSYLRILGLTTVVVALAVAAGCSQGANASWRGAGSSAAPSGAVGGTAKTLVGEIKVTPATDTTEVAVLDSATVTAHDATLNAVTVTNPDGKRVDGDFDADHRSWHTTEVFGYGKRYTVVAKATNVDGQAIERTTSFTTIKPKNKTMPYLRANDLHLLKERSIYGVGQTIQVGFDENITDKAAVQKLLKVTTNPLTEGRVAPEGVLAARHLGIRHGEPVRPKPG